MSVCEGLPQHQSPRCHHMLQTDHQFPQQPDRRVNHTRQIHSQRHILTNTQICSRHTHIYNHATHMHAHTHREREKDSHTHALALSLSLSIPHSVVPPPLELAVIMCIVCFSIRTRHCSLNDVLKRKAGCILWQQAAP